MLYRIEAYCRKDDGYVLDMKYTTPSLCYETFEDALEAAKRFFPKQRIKSQNILKDKVYFTDADGDRYCVHIHKLIMCPSLKFVWRMFKKWFILTFIDSWAV